MLLVRRDDKQKLGEDTGQDDDAVVGGVVSDVIEECTDGGRKAERLRDAKCCVQLNCEGEISSMMNFGEQGETGRILLSNGDEQQRLGEDTGPGDDDDVGGEVPDVVLRCTVDEKKAKRLGDVLSCVQLSLVG